MERFSYPDNGCFFTTLNGIRCGAVRLIANTVNRIALRAPYCETHCIDTNWSFCVYPFCKKWAYTGRGCKQHGGADYLGGDSQKTEELYALPGYFCKRDGCSNRVGAPGSLCDQEHAVPRRTHAPQNTNRTSAGVVPSTITTHGLPTESTGLVQAMETALLERTLERANFPTTTSNTQQRPCMREQCSETPIVGGTRCATHAFIASATCLVRGCTFAVARGRFLCRFHDEYLLRYANNQETSLSTIKMFVAHEFAANNVRQAILRSPTPETITIEPPVPTRIEPESIQARDTSVAQEVTRLFYSEWNGIQPQLESLVTTMVARRMEALDNVVKEAAQRTAKEALDVLLQTTTTPTENQFTQAELRLLNHIRSLIPTIADDEV